MNMASEGEGPEVKRKKMKYNNWMVCLIGTSMLLLCAPASAQLLNPPPQKYAEASEEERLKVAEKELTGKSDVVMVYAEGLCCPSCAIGIRKKISKLDFIDTSGSKKGVDLDPEFQLVTMQLKKNAVVDLKKLAMAIDDAGYTPVRLYKMAQGNVATEKLVVN